MWTSASHASQATFATCTQVKSTQLTRSLKVAMSVLPATIAREAQPLKLWCHVQQEPSALTRVARVSMTAFHVQMEVQTLTRAQEFASFAVEAQLTVRTEALATVSACSEPGRPPPTAVCARQATMTLPTLRRTRPQPLISIASQF